MIVGSKISCMGIVGDGCGGGREFTIEDGVLYAYDDVSNTKIILLENIVTIHHEVIILGDFKLHLDTQSAATSRFNDILASFDIKLSVSVSTHIHGH